MIEMIIGMFEPRSLRLDIPSGSGLIGRDEVIAAISFAANGNELGWQAIRAEFSGDPKAVNYLLEHFSRTLSAHTAHCSDLPELVLSAHLRRPIGKQLTTLVNMHPRWDRERRRAAKLNALINKANSNYDDNEAARLTMMREQILTAARARCEQELMETGRCPRCLGSGRMLRKDADCQPCSATGRIIPDMQVIENKTNSHTMRAVHSALDDIGSASSRFMRDMHNRIRAERDTDIAD